MQVNPAIFHFFLGFVLALLFLYVAYEIYISMTSNPKAKIHDYHEWLSVLSSVAWKRSLEVMADMARQKGVKEEDIFMGAMYHDLARLVGDGLVFEKQIPREMGGYSLMEHHYMLSPKGVDHIRQANEAREEDFAPA